MNDKPKSQSVVWIVIIILALAGVGVGTFLVGRITGVASVPTATPTIAPELAPSVTTISEPEPTKPQISNDPRNDCTRMNANPEFNVQSMLLAKVCKCIAHSQRQVCYLLDVVGRTIRQSRSDHIRITDGFDLFSTMFDHQVIKSRKEIV